MAESMAPMADGTEDPVHQPSPGQSQQSESLLTDLTPGPQQTMMTANLKDDNMTGSDKHIENTVKAIGQGMKATCLQWEQLMVESEQFELLCPTRVDKLLHEAQAMEAHLLHQKEQLINRLRNLSQTLQVAP